MDVCPKRIKNIRKRDRKMVLEIMDLPLAFAFALAFALAFILLIRIISLIHAQIQSKQESTKSDKKIRTRSIEQITPQSFEQLFLQAFYVFIFGIFGIFLMLSYQRVSSTQSISWIVIAIIIVILYGFIFVVDWLQFRKKRRKQKELQKY